MPKVTLLEKVSLKGNPDIKEDIIQKFIYDHPEVLGLGNLHLSAERKHSPLVAD